MPKYLLNPVLAGQSTVQIVIAKRIQQKDISYQASDWLPIGVSFDTLSAVVCVLLESAGGQLQTRISLRR